MSSEAAIETVLGAISETEKVQRKIGYFRPIFNLRN